MIQTWAPTFVSQYPFCPVSPHIEAENKRKAKGTGFKAQGIGWDHQYTLWLKSVILQLRAM
jgi:hypothetical protein